ncbi:hypothetical protein [Nocardioides sp. B-3]|uniref:hypothetical protein n=1 Tax=Nocardioides sp. B-3 TaxID=2895565 RepID=UPI0021524F33|nr:hypothetical protein [Nocardioides sp. B-3]UUZ58679.1 hypothetical protein LP418_21575 [Nocardioides sp. B-3]
MESTSVTADDGVQLRVSSCGSGPGVVVLSGGPGCVHYLGDESLAPVGFRSRFPDPRGVGLSGGGPHDMGQAIEDSGIHPSGDRRRRVDRARTLPGP